MFKKLTNEAAFELIDLLRFPLMLLVVFVHVIPPEAYAVKLAWNVDSIYTLVSELISHEMGRIAVPSFFLFSGYFFFLKIQVFNAKIYVQQIKKRWSTLLVPYLLWIILFVLVVLLKNFIFGKLGMKGDDMFAVIRRDSYGEIFWGGPLLQPLWYLRDLICMVLLSPIFYLLFKYTKRLGLFLLTVTYLLVWESNIQGLSTTAFFFFGVGAFMGIYKYDLMELGVKYKTGKLLIAVLFLGIATIFNATPYHEYWIRPFTLFGVIATLCIGDILVKTSKLRFYLLRLSESVFFIYAIHSIYIINWLKGGFAKLPLSDSGWGKFIGYFTIPIVCLLVCLGMHRLMKKFLPNVLGLFTGGRMSVKSLKK